MRYLGLQRSLPRPLVRYILHFEAAIEDAVQAFAASLPAGARVLDAGAGEGAYAHYFQRNRYLGVDLGIGDTHWDYSKLDLIADLTLLPLHDHLFDACLNVVTLEHVREPARVLAELHRVLRPGGVLLIVVPHEWEEHQIPHDYYRYTRYGMQHLLTQAGFCDIAVQPVGGYFRLLARRLLNGLQFFPGLLLPFAACVLAPPALLLPALDRLDREQHFTLGFVCTARKDR